MQKRLTNLKIFYLIDHGKNFDVKLSRSASDHAISCLDQFGSYNKLALICYDSLIGSDFPIVTHLIPITAFYCYAHSIMFANKEF